MFVQRVFGAAYRSGVSPQTEPAGKNVNGESSS